MDAEVEPADMLHYNVGTLRSPTAVAAFWWRLILYLVVKCHKPLVAVYVSCMLGYFMEDFQAVEAEMMEEDWRQNPCHIFVTFVYGGWMC